MEQGHILENILKIVCFFHNATWSLWVISVA